MSNPDYPWFRLYVREWLTDARVRAMSLAARGAYIDLLCFQWENGAIPEGLAAIARMLGVGLEELEAIWPEISSRFRRVRGRDGLQNPRLENERTASRRRKGNARAAGKASVESRREEKHAEPNLLQTPSKTCSHNYREMTHLTESRSNGSPTILDADADADEDEDEEKIHDSASWPAPPVSNPGPPKVESRRDRTRWPEFVARWNELAAAEDLPKIGGGLSEPRKRKARRIMATMRRRGLDWFDVVSEAIRERRGQWARENRFPSLDQALREEIVDKLAEGFYQRDRGRPGLDRQSEFKPSAGPTRARIIRPEDR